MIILAIETSCDETAIAITKVTGQKKRPAIYVLSNIVSSQVKLHAKYGGVVPNLAKREHQKNLVPILLQALGESGLLNSKIKMRNEKLQFKIQNLLTREPELLNRVKKDIIPLKSPKIDAVAVTNGPGLAPALWVGVNFAKAIAHLWNKPIIPVNHMEGHLYSSLIQATKNHGQKPMTYNLKSLKFPSVALLVSGGHTELVLMKKYNKYQIIGETLDDAAGEAFDKVARILGLKYPGGPEISQLAKRGNADKYKLPSPMINSKDYNFSFSGLKTAVLYLTKDLLQSVPDLVRYSRKDVAASFQKAVVDVLVKKTIRAAEEFQAKTILIGGGVAANEKLRQDLGLAVKKRLPNSKFYIPDPSLTGDNALMISLAAFFTGKTKAPNKIEAQPNLRIES